MWIVFLGRDYDFIYDIRMAFNSKENAINEAAEYAFKNQPKYQKKTKQEFKDELTNKLNKSTIATLDFSHDEYIYYNHVGITLVPVGD